MKSCRCGAEAEAKKGNTFFCVDCLTTLAVLTIQIREALGQKPELTIKGKIDPDAFC